METQPWQVHVAWLARGIKTGKNQPQPLSLFGDDSRLASCFKKSLQSLVAKSLYHVDILSNLKSGDSYGAQAQH